MGKEADLSQPAKPSTGTGDHGGAASPLSPRLWEGAGEAWWDETFCQPHHQGTTATINQGKGAGGDLGGGWEREFLVDQGHKLLGNPALGEPALEPRV